MRFWHLNKHDIAKGQTRAFLDRNIDSSQFVRLLLWLQVFRSVTFKYFHDSIVVYSYAAV